MITVTECFLWNIAGDISASAFYQGWCYPVEKSCSFLVLCFVVLSVRCDSYDLFAHFNQCSFTGTGTIVKLIVPVPVNLDKYGQNQLIIKGNRSANFLHISWDVLYVFHHHPPSNSAPPISPYLRGSVCDSADSSQWTSYINGNTCDQHTVAYGTHKSSKLPSKFSPYLRGSVCDSADSPQRTSYVNGNTCDQHTVVNGTHKSSKLPSKFYPYLQGSVCDSADSSQGTSCINGYIVWSTWCSQSHLYASCKA